MAFCPHCGAPLPDGTRFCTKCGMTLVGEATATEHEPDKPFSLENDWIPDPQPGAPAPGPGPAYTPPQPPPAPVQAPPVQPSAYTRQPVYRQTPVQPPYTPSAPQPPTAAPKKKKKGGCLLGILLLLALAAAAVYLIPRIHIGGEPLPDRLDDPVVSDYDIQSSVLIGQDNPGAELTQHPETVTLAGVSFEMPSDYTCSKRFDLGNSEACLLVPEKSSGQGRMMIRIYPDVLNGVDGLTEEEVTDILSAAVDNLAGVLANKEKSGYDLDYDYEVIRDDDFYPLCYANLAWPDKDRHFTSHTEAILVNGMIVSFCAIAADDELLSDMIAISGHVLAAAEKP